MGIFWQSNSQDSILSLPRVWVQPLVRELRSHKSCTAIKKKKKQSSGIHCVSTCIIHAFRQAGKFTTNSFNWHAIFSDSRVSRTCLFLTVQTEVLKFILRSCSHLQNFGKGSLPPPSTARGKPVSTTEAGPVDIRQVKIKDVLNSHLPTESILITWRKQYDLSTHGPFSLFLLPG